LVPIEELRELVLTTKSREEKARLAAEVIRRAGSYRWVGLYDVEDEEIAVVAWSGPAAPTHPRFPRTQGLNGAAVASGAPVIVQDIRQDSRYLTTLGDTLAEMIVPVRDGTGAIVGTIDVESAEVNAFSARDQGLLDECAAVLRPLWDTR
jgi:L-methionine (R)-S-oxide reductase